MKGLRFNWHWLLALVAIVMFALASKSLFHMAHTLDIAQMRSVLTSTPPLTILKAVGIVIAAYILLSIYDLIAVRYLKADIPYPKILNTSLTAFSIGHTKYGKTYYNFTGLRNFKEKFNPDWEPRYIGIETGLRAGMKPIKGLTDTILLISGGLSSLVKN